MKTHILTIIFYLLLFSCNNNEKTAESTKEKKQSNLQSEVDFELVFNYDKIVLLSNIEGLSHAKVEEIMKAYYTAMYNDKFVITTNNDYQKLIDSIAEKVSLPNQKVASLIFAYVYEMRTKQEIGEEYIEEKEMQEQEMIDKHNEDFHDNYR